MLTDMDFPKWLLEALNAVEEISLPSELKFRIE